MVKIRYIVFIFVYILAIFCFSALAQEKRGIFKVFVFQSPLCGRCIEVKKNILPAIEKEYKGRVEFEYYDLTDVKNYKFLLELREKYGSHIELSLPVFFIEGNFLNGNSDLKNILPVFIEGSILSPKYSLNNKAIDLIAYFKGLRPLVVIGSGLVDGINPCAFTVIVFFISYLALQGYRKRELAVIGLVFIGTVFITYSLIGLGVFNFLYHFKAFWFFAKVFNIGVGAMSILLGAFAIYDLFKFRSTGNTEGLLLQLPNSIKGRIHSIIGLHYRKGAQEKKSLNKPVLLPLVLSALITGFLVSLLEAICTGQLYLPTIAYVLKTTPLKLQAFLYLLIYNIMFIIPLLAVFTLALLGVSSNTFAALLKKHISGVKILMAVTFFGLGIFLIWRG